MAHSMPRFPSALNHPAPYEIRLRGELDPRWSEWFNGMEIAVEPSSGDAPITVLTCPPVDQAMLRGMLNKIWDLNLIIISVQRIELKSKENHEHD